MDQDNHQELTTTATDELRDDQLDKVAGGLVVISVIPILVGMLKTTIQSVKSATGN
jgi:uncharacterized membrane protein